MISKQRIAGLRIDFESGAVARVQVTRTNGGQLSARGNYERNGFSPEAVGPYVEPNMQELWQVMQIELTMAYGKIARIVRLSTKGEVLPS